MLAPNIKMMQYINDFKVFNVNDKKKQDKAIYKSLCKFDVQLLNLVNYINQHANSCWYYWY